MTEHITRSISIKPLNNIFYFYIYTTNFHWTLVSKSLQIKQNRIVVNILIWIPIITIVSTCGLTTNWVSVEFAAYLQRVDRGTLLVNIINLFRQNADMYPPISHDVISSCPCPRPPHLLRAWFIVICCWIMSASRASACI